MQETGGKRVTKLTKTFDQCEAESLLPVRTLECQWFLEKTTEPRRVLRMHASVLRLGMQFLHRVFRASLWFGAYPVLGWIGGAITMSRIMNHTLGRAERPLSAQYG